MQDLVNLCQTLFPGEYVAPQAVSGTSGAPSSDMGNGGAQQVNRTAVPHHAAPTAVQAPGAPHGTAATPGTPPQRADAAVTAPAAAPQVRDDSPASTGVVAGTPTQDADENDTGGAHAAARRDSAYTVRSFGAPNPHSQSGLTSFLNRVRLRDKRSSTQGKRSKLHQQPTLASERRRSIALEEQRIRSAERDARRPSQFSLFFTKRKDQDTSPRPSTVSRALDAAASGEDLNTANETSLRADNEGWGRKWGLRGSPSSPNLLQAAMHQRLRTAATASSAARSEANTERSASTIAANRGAAALKSASVVGGGANYKKSKEWVDKRLQMREKLLREYEKLHPASYWSSEDAVKHRRFSEKVRAGLGLGLGLCVRRLPATHRTTVGWTRCRGNAKRWSRSSTRTRLT